MNKYKYIIILFSIINVIVLFRYSLFLGILFFLYWVIASLIYKIGSQNNNFLKAFLWPLLIVGSQLYRDIFRNELEKLEEKADRKIKRATKKNKKKGTVTDDF